MLRPTISVSGRRPRIAQIMLLLAACGGLTVDPEIENPVLLDLRVRQYVSPIMGAVVIEGVTDTGFVTATATRLAATVQVQREPELSLLLWPRICHNGASQPFSCREFSVIMESGGDVTELNGLLPQISGRILSILSDGLHANVAIMGGDVAEAVVTVKQWAGVEDAYLNYIGAILDGTQLSRQLRGYVPVDSGSLGTGVFALEAGDTVTALYTQPDGNILTARGPITFSTAIIN